MHPEQTPVVVDLNKVQESGQLDDLQHAMNEMAEAQNAYEQNLVKELGVSAKCASDIAYLRSRHRWSQELENQLIEAHKRGEEVNIFQFGVTAETQQALQDSVEKQLLAEGYTLEQIRG